ncbi:MAG: CNNM domain-containing protein [Candidatus Poseidonia sp.]|nr:CNNM domain-containing protein [Poseidonia sp.]MCH1616123.1 CNNM domain-containing protein [Poseidonia sp.]
MKRHFEEPSTRRLDYARKGRGLRDNMPSDLIATANLAVNATGEGDMTLLIFYITLALGVSFLCSILEAVVLSTPQTYVNILQNEGKRTADMWAHLKDDDSVRPLTAILTLNTIAHTMGAAGVGSQVQQIWGVEVLTLASAILTLAVLFLSEIIPKTLGAAYWRRLSTPSAYLLTGFTKALFFLIGPIQFIKSVLPKSKNAMVTRDDVAAMADLGEIEGALEKAEETIIHNLLELRDVLIDDEMTPRTVVSAFDMNHTIAEVLKENTILRFSRIPVYDDNIDNVRGLVIRSEILMAASRDEWEVQLKDIMKPILKLDKGSTVDQALDVFLSNQQQFALVRDEFGGTSGILTMEDVMEKLLGKEIVDELDPVDDMRKFAREQAAQAEEAE